MKKAGASWPFYYPVKLTSGALAPHNPSVFIRGLNNVIPFSQFVIACRRCLDTVRV